MHTQDDGTRNTMQEFFDLFHTSAGVAEFGQDCRILQELRRWSDFVPDPRAVGWTGPTDIRDEDRSGEEGDAGVFVKVQRDCLCGDHLRANTAAGMPEASGVARGSAGDVALDHGE